MVKTITKRLRAMRQSKAEFEIVTSIIPQKHICQRCKDAIEADYQLDPGRWLHLTGWCKSCDCLATDKIVSNTWVPFEYTRYDYTIRKTAARPAMIAASGIQCEKCQANASGTFNVIKEIATPWERGWGDRAFELMSGPHHRCIEHLMPIEENVLMLDEVQS